MQDFRMETFFAVCECLNYTRAAEKLHITQPAVSQQIRYLEEYYHAPLFYYEKRTLHLTKKGTFLYQAMQKIKRDEKEIAFRMASETIEEVPLNFGATMTIAEFQIAEPLISLLQQNPRKKVHMLMGNTKELLEKMEEGTIAFAIVEGFYPMQEYETMPLSHEKFIGVAAKGHKFSKKGKLKIEDLLSEKWILREEGSGTREVFEKNLEAKNRTKDELGEIFEIGNMNVILKMVEADLGITFLYQKAAETGLKENRLQKIALEDFSVSHDFSLIWKKGSLFSEEYREIGEKIKAQL